MSIIPLKYIYFRQSNGISHQYQYDPIKTIKHILTNIYKQILPNIKLISKGKLIDTQTNLLINQIQPNQIIHIINIQKYQQLDNGLMYISYENKIYTIQFYSDQTVQYFKNKVHQSTGLQSELQVIVFNSLILQNQKKIQDYHIKNGDFLSMSKKPQLKPLVFDFPQVIYPKKQDIEKRRGSECAPKINLSSSDLPKTNLINIIHPKLAYINMSPSSKYGPEPYSQDDMSESFKTSMDDWNKNKDLSLQNSNQKVSQTGQNSFWTKLSLVQQKKRIFQSVNPHTAPYKIQVIPVNNNNPKIDLCQSLSYSDKQDTEKSNGIYLEKSLENSINKSEEKSIIFQDGEALKGSGAIQAHPNRLLPKFTVSTELSTSRNFPNLIFESQIIEQGSKLKILNLKNRKIFIINSPDFPMINSLSIQQKKQTKKICTIQQLRKLIFDLQFLNEKKHQINFYYTNNQSQPIGQKLTQKQIMQILQTQQQSSNYNSQQSLKNQKNQNKNFIQDNVIGYVLYPIEKQ